jgi:hypothetical protein
MSTNDELKNKTANGTKPVLSAVFIRIRTIMYFTALPYLIGKICYIIGVINPDMPDHFVQHVASGYVFVFVMINILFIMPLLSITVVSTILYYIFTGKYLLENEKLNEHAERYWKLFVRKTINHFRSS